MKEKPNVFTATGAVATVGSLLVFLYMLVAPAVKDLMFWMGVLVVLAVVSFVIGELLK